jgi:hypothetical protein
MMATPIRIGVEGDGHVGGRQWSRVLAERATGRDVGQSFWKQSGYSTTGHNPFFYLYSHSDSSPPSLTLYTLGLGHWPFGQCPRPAASLGPTATPKPPLCLS